MLERYLPRFHNLNPPEIELITQRLIDHRLVPGSPVPAAVAELPQFVAGEALYQLCESAHLTQADVVCAIADVPGPIAQNAIETLVGQPITRPVPAPEVQKRIVTETIRSQTDSRTIHNIRPNPKRPGSASHTRYNKYTEGMTVQEYLDKGGLMSDIRWDTRKEFIQLRGERAT
jgi:hypothetical protein